MHHGLKKGGLQLKYLTLVLVMMVICSLVVGFISYRIAAEDLENQIRQKALVAARLGASMLDGDVHRRFTQADSRNTEAYLAYQKQLEQIRRLSGVTFAYTTVQLDAKEKALIVDADTGEDAAPFGKKYPVANDSRSAFAGTAACSDAPFYENGTWLITAFAPIYDHQGQVVAALGVDVDVVDLMTEQHRLLTYIAIATLFVILLGCFLAVILVKRIVKPIQMVVAQIDRLTASRIFNISHFDVEAITEEVWQEIDLKIPAEMLARQDETGVLAHALWQMKLKLHNMLEELLNNAEEYNAAIKQLKGQGSEKDVYAAKTKTAFLDTVEAIAVAIEARDPFTEGHCGRVVAYCMDMARAVCLPEELSLQLELAARLHDIGKLKVPEAVLSKSAPLEDEEWQLVREHPRFGQKMLDGIDYLAIAGKIICQHHERYDGTGYPDQLSGEDISLAARILAIADAYSVMTSVKGYRQVPYSAEKALAELRSQAGQQFDPELVEVFCRILV